MVGVRGHAELMHLLPRQNATIGGIHGGALLSLIRTPQIDLFALFERATLTVIGKKLITSSREPLTSYERHRHHRAHMRFSLRGKEVVSGRTLAAQESPWQRRSSRCE